MFQVTRDEDGWRVFSHEFEFESLFVTYSTRRQAITAVQMMRTAEEMIFTLTRHCEDEGA